MERRTLLRAAPGALLAGFTGCLGNDDSGDQSPSGPPETGTESPSTNLGLEIENSLDESIDLRVEILAESGTSIDEFEAEIGAEAYESTETEISSPGLYTVVVSFADRESTHEVSIEEYQLRHDRSIVVVISTGETRVVVQV